MVIPKLGLKIGRFLKRKRSFFQLKVANYWFLLFFLLVVFYFITRLYRLTLFPIFADEAIYLRWAQVMRAEPTLRFLPLQDGKQPLFMWLVIPFLKVFNNPLFAGRLVSVISGLATMIGIGILSLLVGGGVGLSFLTMLLYLFLPFCLFFDRMALVDSLLSAFGIWSLILVILGGRTTRLDVAMILGIVLGGGLLTKSPAIFFVLMAPVGVILVSGLKIKKRGVKLGVEKFLKLLGLILVAEIFAFTLYNILRLGPNFHMIGIRNKDYVWPITEVLKHPWNPLIPHLKDVIRYYGSYLTLPVLFLGGLGILRIVFREKKKIPKEVLIGWWLLPLLVQAGVAKVFTARYILFSVPLFILFSGWGLALVLEKGKSWVRGPVKKSLLMSFLVGVILLPALFFDWWLWRDPTKAYFPQDERRGYLEDWTAGWGIREIADYLRSLPREKNIIVGTEGFFGTLPEGLQIYLEGEPKITVIGVGYPIKGIPESLLNAKKAGDRVYLVVNQSRLELEEKGDQLKLIREYSKPGGDKLLFFEITNF